ncbi:MAG: glycosyltransferase family 4 protein [Porphyromonas sp.]|nr:glycosyltransferase family 4 protein [Porphyromonas sp.]
MKKLLRLVTISDSFGMIEGQPQFLRKNGYKVIGISGPPVDLSEKAASRERFRTIVIPNLVRPISIDNDLKALFQLIKVIKKEKPLIVHANTPKASLLGMMAAWWCHVPHRIYTVTGLRFETTTGLFRWVLIRMERITCACATKVIPEGDGVAKTLRGNRITKKPLKKILNGNINGINLNYFSRSEDVLEQAKRISDKTGGSFTFIFIGRIVKDKGIMELVNAFQKIHVVYPDSRLLLVGKMESDLDPLPDEVIRDIQDNDCIIEAGWQTDVRPWLASSDTLVLPSYREGFPNVVIQAGAMGLPVVVSDINGCNEIVIEGENGYIVPARDSDALYHGMLKMIEDKNQTIYMSKNARPMIESRYEQSAVWQALLQEYNSLIDNE